MEVEKKIIVMAVDESEESMYALSWCLNNIISVSQQNNCTSNTTLVLLYVKPPPPAYSAFDVAGKYICISYCSIILTICKFFLINFSIYV